MKLRDFGVCVELRATRFLQSTESQILYMFISFSKSYSDFSSCFFRYLDYSELSCLTGREIRKCESSVRKGGRVSVLTAYGAYF